MLTYICQRTLADPAAVIKEHEIGCSALGRKSDFDPHEDNIVRVQISHLRKKLDEHFATEGKDEPIQITIPKGAYVPRFQPKPQAIPPAPIEQRTSPAVRFAVRFLAGSTAVLSLLCLYLAFRSVNPHQAGPAIERRTAAQDPFWSRIFGGSQPASIVVADSCLVMLQDVLHADITVADYASGQFPGARLNSLKDVDLKSALQLLAARQYTSLADLNVSTKLMDVGRQFGPNQVSIRYARHLNIRDFKTGNFVLNGSRRGIPWVELFEPHLNFAMEDDKTGRFYFRNRAPTSGEEGSYSPAQKDGALESYADLALLPNLGNNGSVLLLSGISMADTEAAGELLTRKESWKELSRILGLPTLRDGYFELLVKTRVVAGAAGSAKIVSFRIIQPSTSSR